MEKPAVRLLINSPVLSFLFHSFPFFSSQTLNRNDAVDVTFSLKGLYDDTKAFLDENLVSAGVGAWEGKASHVKMVTVYACFQDNRDMGSL